MTSPTTAFKHRYELTGMVFGRSPNVDGFTPATIISGQGLEYTAGELVIATTDDTNVVQNAINMTQTFTGRSNTMFRYDGLSGISSLDFLHRFSYIVNGTQRLHNIRLYIYDFNLATWEEMASLGGDGAPRTFTGDADGPNFADYQDGVGGPVYVLHWDFEGTFRPQAGCINANTKITLESGKQIKASEVKFADKITTRLYGERVARKVDETTRHHFAKLLQWNMVRVHIRGELFYEVTDGHWCPIGLGDEQKRAADLVDGDEIPDVHGNLHRIPKNGIKTVRKSVEVIDLDVRNTNYEVNGGLLLRTMPYG